MKCEKCQIEGAFAQEYMGYPCPFVSDGGWGGELISYGTNTINLGFYTITESYCRYSGISYLGVQYTGTREFGMARVAYC